MRTFLGKKTSFRRETQVDLSRIVPWTFRQFSRIGHADFDTDRGFSRSLFLSLSRTASFFSPASWKLGGLTRHRFGGDPESNLLLSVPLPSFFFHSLPASFRPKQLHRADFQRTWVSGSRSFTVVFVALSHCYLSDRGNVLALSPINPSPRDHWTHDIHVSPWNSLKNAPATSSPKIFYNNINARWKFLFFGYFSKVIWKKIFS